MNKSNEGVINTSFIQEEDGKKDSSNKRGDAKKKTADNNALKDDEAPSEPPKTASDAFDRILKSVGGSGIFQWKLWFITAFSGLLTAFHNLGAVFLAASPKHWCKIPSLNFNATLAERVINYTIPLETNKDGVLSHSKCKYIDLDYSNYSFVEDFYDLQNIQNENTSQNVRYCDSWHYDTSTFVSTLVSEFNLVCGRRWLMSVTQASFMFGILVGAVVASSFSDKIGRRKVALVGTVIFFVTSVLAAFSSSFDMFLTFRFFVAAAGQGLYLVNYVLLMETLEGPAKTPIVITFGLFFITGSSLLPLLAYYLNEWRKLQLTTGALNGLLLAYFWILPESPRWLLLQRRNKEGLEVLESIAKSNGRSLPPKDELDLYLKVISEEGFIVKERSNWKRILEFYENLVTLVKTPNIRRRNLTMFYAWFAVSSVYYGLTFSGYNLNMSLYLLVFSVSVVGYPIALSAIWFTERFGRRLTLAASFSTCGVACLIILLIPNEYVWVNMALVVVGRGMAGLCFRLVYICTSELNPTNIRNLSLGIASMWGRIGSIISPFIVDLLGEIYYSIPSTFFGVMTLLAGGLTLLIPETGFTPLQESVQEIENSPR